RPAGPNNQSKQVFEEPGSAALLVSFHAVGFDVASALKGLAQQRRQLADLGLGVGSDPADAAADADDRMDRQWEDEERNETKKPVLVEHHRDEEGDRDRILAHATENVRRGAAQKNGVAGKAGYQGAGGMGLKISEIGAHQSREQRLLHISDDPLAAPDHLHGTAVIAKPLGDGESEGQAGEQP